MAKVLVERELLSRAAKYLDGYNTADELRAILAQPAHDVASVSADTMNVPVETLLRWEGELDQIACAGHISDEIVAMFNAQAAAPQPVAQEPVAAIKARTHGTEVHWLVHPEHLSDGTKLYASPVAQQKVVMPEQFPPLSTPERGWDKGYEDGWNACLDEFERLNRSNTNER